MRISDNFFEVEGAAASAALKKAFNKLLSAPAYTDPLEAYRANLSFIKVPQKETPVTHGQWEKLYEVANNIRLLAPWKHLHESERITLLLPGRDEPVYIVVMGSGDMTYGIGIYPGYDSLSRLLRMNERIIDKDDLSVAFEQHCINLYFGDREELRPNDKDVIKKLGLKFRGRSKWPYFRSMKPGFAPWFINYEEAELTIAALQNFTMAFMSYHKQSYEVDFRAGQTLLRFYDTKAGMWYNTGIKMPPEPFIQPKLVMTDDILMAGLKKKKKSRTKIGAAVTYMPVPVQEDENERPRMPHVVVLINIDSGIPIEQATNMESEFIGKTITDMLARYVTKHGRPPSIAVRDKDTGYYIEDFAEKLGIKLVVDERLSAVNSMVMRLMGMMESGEFKDFMGDSPTPLNHSTKSDNVARSLVLSVSVGPRCYRHIQISESDTLFALHEVILNSFDFSNDHMHAFFMNNIIWNEKMEFICPGVDLEGAKGYSDEAKLSHFSLTKDSKFLYLFDFGDEWRFQIKVLRIVNEPTKEPLILKSVGQVSQYGEDECFD